MAAAIGTGTKIAFGTTGFTAEILDITLPARTRGTVDTSHMGTTDAHTQMPLTLQKNEALEFSIHLDPNPVPAVPLDADPEIITVTFPDASTWTFTGFMTNYAASVPFEDKMAADITVEISGNITVA